MSNNDKLIKIMRKHNFSCCYVARVLEVSTDTVKSWRRRKNSDGYRNMRPIFLRALETHINEINNFLQ